jgi:NADH-quinone oxidoreductase subunit K
MTGMVYNYKNFLITMMCVEIMYLGTVTGFIMYGVAFHDVLASIYALLIVIFAACESAIGLGLLVAVYRYGRSIGFNSFVDLGG